MKSFAMRLWILIVSCFVFCLEGLAQERGVLVGGSLGLNALGTWNKSDDMMDTQPRLGWSGSAVVMYDMKRPFRLTGQLGGVVEKQHEVMIPFDGGFDGTDSYTYDTKYSWGEATALISYMPIRRQVFGLFTGTGFSARRLISAGGQTEINGYRGTARGEFDAYDLMYKWNYLLPFQLGVSFDLAESGMVIITTEYQLGLRNRFKHPPYNNSTTFDYVFADSNQKPQSLSIKVAYLFGI